MSIIRDGTNGITFPDTTVKYGNIPQVTIYTSGSGTYTVPTGCKYLQIELVGGGGGGGGSGVGIGGTGTAGGSTTFGTSLLIASGGNGSAGYIPQGGGFPTLNSPAVGVAFFGGLASGAMYQVSNGGGTNGGCSPFGGSGSGGAPGGTSGGAATANTGSGGGGGGSAATVASCGAGGQAGNYIKALITSSLASTYSYAVGAAGSAGSAGTSGAAGGAGGSGVIIVTAYF